MDLREAHCMLLASVKYLKQQTYPNETKAEYPPAAGPPELFTAILVNARDQGHP